MAETPLPYSDLPLSERVAAVNRELAEINKVVTERLAELELAELERLMARNKELDAALDEIGTQLAAQISSLAPTGKPSNATSFPDLGGPDERIARFLRDKWKQGECPVCRTNAWTVGSLMVQLPANEGVPLQLSGSSYPVVPIFCNNCGYALLFHAHTMGMFDPVAPPPETGSSERP